MAEQPFEPDYLDKRLTEIEDYVKLLMHRIQDFDEKPPLEDLLGTLLAHMSLQASISRELVREVRRLGQPS